MLTTMYAKICSCAILQLINYGKDMKKKLITTLVLVSFNVGANSLTSEEMDAADYACSHQSLDSKHKGINATSASYNKGESRINVVCSDNNELVLLSAREKKALYNLNVAKEKGAAIDEKIRDFCEQHNGDGNQYKTCMVR